MKHSPKHNEVKAILKDVDESQKRADKRLARFDAKREKAMLRMEANMEKSKKEADLRYKQLNEQLAEAGRVAAEASRVTEKNGEQLGGFTNNYGEALENKFAEALRKAKQIGEFNLHQVDVRAGTKHEFDLVATNGDVVIVGEVKVKLLPSDVEHFITKRLPRFASDCPVFARNRLIYGMICSQNIVTDAEELAKKHGLFIARLENKEIVINDANAQALH